MMMSMQCSQKGEIMFFTTDYDEFMQRVEEIERKSNQNILRFDLPEEGDQIVEKIQQKLNEPKTIGGDHK